MGGFRPSAATATPQEQHRWRARRQRQQHPPARACEAEAAAGLRRTSRRLTKSGFIGFYCLLWGVRVCGASGFVSPRAPERLAFGVWWLLAASGIVQRPAPCALRAYISYLQCDISHHMLLLFMSRTAFAACKYPDIGRLISPLLGGGGWEPMGGGSWPMGGHPAELGWGFKLL
jgi:hypothetical protein